MKTTLLLFLIFFFLNASAKTYYFSNLFGNDLRTEAQAQDQTTPWKTIDKMNAFFNGSSPHTFLAGDQILLARGETFYTSTGININRSGASGSPIYIGTYGTGARPIITSMVNLTWQSLGSSLYRSHELLSGNDSINVVCVNNLPTQMGRWPQLDNGNGGYNSIASAINSTSFTQKTTGGELTGQPSYIFGAEVVYKAARFWIERERISAYDASTHTITFKYKRDDADAPPQDPATSGGVTRYWGYFIQDDSSTLTYAGAWWFKKNKYVKMFSPSTPTNVTAATSDNLFNSSSSFAYIDVDNIDFNGCNQDAIFIDGGNNINISNCIIENAGRNGIKLGTDHCSFTYDSIVNCLSKGITFAAGSDHTIIRHCIIRNTGQLIGHGDNDREDGHANHSGVGIYVGTDHVDNQTIEYNTITNSGYNGIHFKRQDSVIVRYNYIDSVCNVTDDGGGIYSFSGDGKSTSINSGVKTIHNIVLNGVGAQYGWPQTGDPNAGVKGIYHDEWTNHDITDSNTVAYFEDGIFANNGCNNNFVRNNTFYANTSSGIHFNSRASDHTRKLVATNNLVYAAGSTDYALILHVYQDPAAFDSFGTIDHNIYLRPLGTANIFRYENQTSSSSTTSTNTDISGWRAVMKYDDNSSTTPYTFANSTNQSDSTLFRFNATAAPVTSSISGTWKDIYNVSYTNSITIPAFSSAILNKVTDVTPPPPPPPPPPAGQRIKSRRRIQLNNVLP